LNSNPPKLIWFDDGEDIADFALPRIPLEYLAIDHVVAVVKKQCRLVGHRVRGYPLAMLVVAIEVKQQFGNGLQPLSEFGDDPHLLSTVRFYRYFFGEQLRKLLQMAMGDAVDVRFERRLAGGYGGGPSCLYGQGCALPYLTTASNFLR